MNTPGLYQTRSFAACHKEETIRIRSSSGGAFYSIAKAVIEKGGLVFGAAFDDDGQVIHTACADLNSLEQLMRSKYVQSSPGDTFRQIKEALLNGRQVLFSGTPCQVYGLLSFIEMSVGEEKNNLITMDFVCHGVPSRLVWRKYLDQISEKHKPVSISFRDKTNGWLDFSLKILFDDQRQYLCSWHKEPYVQGFIKNLFLRESCYS